MMPSDLVEPIGRYLREGGFVMPPLLGATVVLWYALGYRMLTLRRGFRGSLRSVARRRGEGDERGQACGILGRAVRRGQALRARWAPDQLRPALDDAFYELEREMDRYAAPVTAIVAAAPLTGLLGTVAGMIETFDALGDMSLFSQSGGIAGGISQALISTQMGLAVAIPGLLIGRLLVRRQRRLEQELAQLKDLLCGEHAR